MIDSSAIIFSTVFLNSKTAAVVFLSPGNKRHERSYSMNHRDLVSEYKMIILHVCGSGTDFYEKSIHKKHFKLQTLGPQQTLFIHPLKLWLCSIRSNLIPCKSLSAWTYTLGLCLQHCLWMNWQVSGNREQRALGFCFL